MPSAEMKAAADKIAAKTKMIDLRKEFERQIAMIHVFGNEIVDRLMRHEKRILKEAAGIELAVGLLEKATFAIVLPDTLVPIETQLKYLIPGKPGAMNIPRDEIRKWRLPPEYEYVLFGIHSGVDPKAKRGQFSPTIAEAIGIERAMSILRRGSYEIRADGAIHFDRDHEKVPVLTRGSGQHGSGLPVVISVEGKTQKPSLIFPTYMGRVCYQEFASA